MKSLRRPATTFQLKYAPGDFVHTLGDAHLYSNHFEQAREQLSREPLPLPALKLAKRDSIFDYTFDDIAIEGYVSHAPIRAAVAV